MTDLLCQDEDAGEVMNYQSRPDLGFACDMDPGDRHAENVDKQVESDQDLADDRNLDRVSPRAKSIDDDGKSSEFEKRRDRLRKKV